MIDTEIRLSPETIAPPNTLTEVPVTELLGKAGLDGDGSLTRQVYHLLRQLIVNLHLQPNQFLPEKEVAAVLNISKTPVREAFIRLSEENLVNIVPKIGTYVAPIDIKQAFKGYFIRESLESACAESLAHNLSGHGLAMLLHEMDEQQACLEREDFDMFYILDNQFHAAMFDAADMPTAKRLVDSAKAEVDRIKGLKSIYRFCRPEAVLYQEHKDMLDAIRNHDGRQARLEVRKHLTGMSEAIQAIVKEEKLWRLFNTINQGPHARLSG